MIGYLHHVHVNNQFWFIVGQIPKFPTIIQKKNLDLTNVYPQLDRSTRPKNLRTITQLRILVSLVSKPWAPGKRGTLAWITGAVLLRKARFCFV